MVLAASTWRVHGWWYQSVAVAAAAVWIETIGLMLLLVLCALKLLGADDRQALLLLLRQW